MQNNIHNSNRNFSDIYLNQVRQTILYMLGWGAFVVLSSCIAGNVSSISGFLLGFTASLLYYILLCARVKKSAEMTPGQAVVYMRYGWLIRLSFILSVLIISLKLPGIEFASVVAGLFSLQIVIIAQSIIIVVVGVITKYKNKLRKE